MLRLLRFHVELLMRMDRACMGWLTTEKHILRSNDPWWHIEEDEALLSCVYLLMVSLK